MLFRMKKQVLRVVEQAEIDYNLPPTKLLDRAE